MQSTLLTYEADVGACSRRRRRSTLGDKIAIHAQLFHEYRYSTCEPCNAVPPLSDCHIAGTVVLFNGLLRSSSRYSRQVRHMQQRDICQSWPLSDRVGCLAANNADILKTFDGLSIRVINIHRHLQITILA